MHALILAGGRGSRLQEFTGEIPKGLVRIGELTLLDHIIVHLSQHGVHHIWIAAGYLGERLHSHFANHAINLPVTVLDTGLETDTAARVRQSLSMSNDLTSADHFLLCWSDALSNLNFSAMVDLHQQTRAAITMAAVHPPARFGELDLEGDKVVGFSEKPPRQEWISGGYFVVDPRAFMHLETSMQSWDYEVLPAVTEQGRLRAYRHCGEWQCMDTYSDFLLLSQMAADGEAFWPAS